MLEHRSAPGMVGSESGGECRIPIFHSLRWDGRMADRTRPVTATEVRAVVARGAPRRFTVGDGLHLWVKGPGKAQWVLRYRTPDGKRRDMGLGSYPKVSLADARAAATAARLGTKD